MRRAHGGFAVSDDVHRTHRHDDSFELVGPPLPVHDRRYARGALGDSTVRGGERHPSPKELYARLGLDPDEVVNVVAQVRHLHDVLRRNWKTLPRRVRVREPPTVEPVEAPRAPSPPKQPTPRRGVVRPASIVLPGSPKSPRKTSPRKVINARRRESKLNTMHR